MKMAIGIEFIQMDGLNKEVRYQRQHTQIEKLNYLERWKTIITL